MKHSTPAAPTRFASGHKPHTDDHATGHFAAKGAWICHTGRVRQGNEDSVLAAGKVFTGSIEKPMKIDVGAGSWIVAVSDGIGGHRGGAEASRGVVEALAACPRVTPASVAEVLHKLNREYCVRGQTNSELAGMGATVAGIGCGGRGLFAFNVGDSRVYRHEGKKLVQITRDDSEAEDLIDVGLLQPYDGPRPGFLHALTQAIGGREEVFDIDTHMHPLRVEKQARLLVCSDGLTDMLHSPEILQVLNSEHRADRAVAALFDRAMNVGGVDNITLAVIDVEKV
jgi:serine/threonine protein phosphatase PrpC